LSGVRLAYLNLTPESEKLSTDDDIGYSIIFCVPDALDGSPVIGLRRIKP